VYLFIYWKKIKNGTLRSYFRALCVMGGVCLAAFFLDLILHFEEKIGSISGGFRVGVAIYLFWNLITLYFALRHFTSTKDNLGKKLVHFNTKYALTPQEQRVVELILEGRNNPEIGEKLFISPGTVKRHVYNIFKKTKAASRLDLLRRIREA
jgi:DNA-binding CsgD family transcriptional regulator